MSIYKEHFKGELSNASTKYSILDTARAKK